MKYDNIKLKILLSLIGISILTIAVVIWCVDTQYTIAQRALGMISAVLAAVIYLKFIPQWQSFWSNEYISESIEESETPKYTYIMIFVSLIVFVLITAVIVFIFRYIKGYDNTITQSLKIWYDTDARHYIDIARDGYLSQGHNDRLVQLVFLPGYPVLVKLFSFISGEYLFTAFTVSTVCLGIAGCMFYKLLRLDYNHKDSIRAIKYLVILPASFFFTGPMSESLFLLLAICCIYCARTQKWLLAGLSGGYCAFTRSIGITLLVVLFLEYVREYFESNKLNTVKKTISSLMVASGFGVYCVINYIVSGNFFKFMQYQKEHWYQGFGWFFDTVAYQLEYLSKNIYSDINMVLGLWIPNLIMIFLSLIIMLLAAKKLRPSYTAWFIGYFIIAIGATWLLSAPRYLVAFFPLTISLMLITKNKKADALMTVCFITLNIAYLYAFSMRWAVW